MFVKRAILAGGALPLGFVVVAQQSGLSDEAGRVLALENAWNHAIEAKDTQALDMLMAPTMVALGSDASFLNKDQYWRASRTPSSSRHRLSRSSNVQMYGDTAIAVTVFRMKDLEKGKTVVHRERTVDTWVKINGTWKCVAAVAVTIPSKSASD